MLKFWERTNSPMARWGDLDIEYIWVFIAFPISMVSIDSKKTNLPLPSLGQNFLCLFIDWSFQMSKKSKKKIKNGQNIAKFGLDWKEISCRLRKWWFCHLPYKWFLKYLSKTQRVRLFPIYGRMLPVNTGFNEDLFRSFYSNHCWQQQKLVKPTSIVDSKWRVAMTLKGFELALKSLKIFSELVFQ